MGDELLACRVCLKNSMECIYLGSPLQEHDSITYRDGLNISTQLNAQEDDDLPKNLCFACADELKNAYQFIQKARMSDQILRNKINVGAVTQIDPPNFDGKLYEVKEEEAIEIKEEPVAEIDENYSENKEKDKELVNLGNLETDDQNKVQLQDPGNGKGKILFIIRSSLKSDKLLLCNNCGKSCSQSRRSSKGKAPYKCKLCDRSYYVKRCLETHMTTHTGNDGQNKCNSKKYVCEVCGKALTSAQNLRIHKSIHTGEKEFECTLCPYRFPTKFRLRDHMRVHTGERPYECNVCGLKFAKGYTLKNHMTIHTGEKAYECKVCGKRFSLRSGVQRHMTRHAEKEVQCPKCDKKFYNRAQMNMHRMQDHVKVTYTCAQCGKVYLQKYSLKMHMLTHMGQQPFNCEICSKSFLRGDRYRDHLKKAHDKDLMNMNATDAAPDERYCTETKNT